MPTVGSLFSGIGGLDLGLERAGFTVRWQSEADPFCSRVLARHWPGVPNLGDIRTVDWSGVEPVDLVCGGFPCQPVSAAGRQKAQEDERWLWPEFARAVRELRPRRVLAENVPALLSVASGRAAQEVFGDLALLGFDAEWSVVSAADLGAPHLRKRVFIVALAVSEGLEVALLQQDGRQRPAPERGGDQRRIGAVEPGVGQPAPGLPGRVARWPARRGEPQFDWEAPRTALGVSERTAKLRALGNAVVPDVAEYVGRYILSGGRRHAP